MDPDISWYKPESLGDLPENLSRILVSRPGTNFWSPEPFQTQFESPEKKHPTITYIVVPNV
jgi:hypothetical protein